jgi:hypothetical protein
MSLNSIINFYCLSIWSRANLRASCYMYVSTKQIKFILIWLGLLKFCLETWKMWMIRASLVHLILEGFITGVAKVWTAGRIRPCKDFLQHLCQILNAQLSYFCNKKYPKLTSIMSYLKKNKPKFFCGPKYNILMKLGP